MAHILASCGSLILVDQEDLARVSARSWHISKRGYPRTQIRIDGKRVSLHLHRFVINAPPNSCVDHINRNKLDNRKKNLRVVTAEVNSINRGPEKKKASRFKGVAKHPSGWQVYVRGKYVGIFKTEEEAARAYDKAARAEFGDFAVTNRRLKLL